MSCFSSFCLSRDIVRIRLFSYKTPTTYTSIKCVLFLSFFFELPNGFSPKFVKKSEVRFSYLLHVSGLYALDTNHPNFQYKLWKKKSFNRNLKVLSHSPEWSIPLQLRLNHPTPPTTTPIQSLMKTSLIRLRLLLLKFYWLRLWLIRICQLQFLFQLSKKIWLRLWLKFLFYSLDLKVYYVCE